MEAISRAWCTGKINYSLICTDPIQEIVQEIYHKAQYEIEYFKEILPDITRENLPPATDAHSDPVVDE
jgi:hypothetical protein